MTSEFKFGDVVEWDLEVGVIQWLIICKARDRGYRAIWMSGGDLRAGYSARRPVNILGDPRSGDNYRVVSDD